VTYKLMVFRIPETIKKDFKVVLLKHGLDVQHTMESFAEHLIAYHEGTYYKDPFKSIIERSQYLAKGA